MSLRVLIAVTHLLGAGHLTRAAALGRALAARGHRATLVTGGTPSPLIDMRGLEVVQLPPVRSPVGDFTTLLDAASGGPAGPDLLSSRRDLLLATFAEFRPEVVLTELYPFGRRILAAEFGALVAAAEAANPRPLVASSVRDILAVPRKAASVALAHEIARRSYDSIYVHGEAAILPLESSWPVEPDLAARLRYTGYVGPEAVPADPDAAVDPASVLVSGGSSAGALPLYRFALQAAAETPALRWHVLTGAGVEEADHQALVRSRTANVTVERARPDFRDLMRKSAIFVGQAGYNTVMDIVATQPRAVLAPFERNGEVEQRIRAVALAARGLASILPEAELDAGSLRREVEAALARPRPVFPPIRLDGAAVTAAAIEQDLAKLRRDGRSGATA